MIFRIRSLTVVSDIFDPNSSRIAQTVFSCTPARSIPRTTDTQHMLNQAFAGSKDINVIAAIVLPLDDDRVKTKCRGHLALTKDQRVELWRGNHSRHDWMWVYDRSEKEWHSFRRRLSEAIGKDEFDLSFVCVCGPDYARLNAPFPWGSWDCDEYIVGNVGRKADFVTCRKTLELLRLKGCEKWEPISEDDEHAYHRAEESVAWLAGASFLVASHVMEDKLRKGKDPASA